MQRIIFRNIDLSIGIIIPAPEALETMSINDIALKDVPQGLQYWIVDTAIIPTDRTYRDAWVFDDITGAIFVDPIKSAPILSNTKWQQVKDQWDTLTVTTSLNNTFAANEESMRMIDLKANNMSDTAIILWKEDWATFNTNIIELKEALNLAADAHQAIINSVFGV